MKPEFDPDEFITNPSPASAPLIALVKKHATYYTDLFASRNPVRVFQREVAMRVYIEEDYKSYFRFLNQYQLPDEITGSKDKLIAEFDRLYKQVIKNTTAIAYLHSKGEEVTNTYQTVEDQKNILLQQIANGAATPDAFRQRFGHYALEPFEVTEKRFAAYTDNEISQLAELMKTVSFQEKPVLTDDVIKKSNRATIAILIAVREMGKDTSLRVVEQFHNIQ